MIPMWFVWQDAGTYKIVFYSITYSQLLNNSTSSKKKLRPLHRSFFNKIDFACYDFYIPIYPLTIALTNFLPNYFAEARLARNCSTFIVTLCVPDSCETVNSLIEVIGT